MSLKKLTNFPGYLISPDGTIYSDKRKTRKPLSPRNINGYDTVVLTVDGKQYVKYIHKLVAEELIYNDDPKNKTEVIHIDGNKRNNAVSNLKWVKKGEGASRYFKTSDTRRNKFDKSYHVPGMTLEGTFIYKVEKPKDKEALPDRELAGQINRLTREIETIKSRYNRQISKLEMKFQKQVRQLKEHYHSDPEKAKIKELTRQRQATIKQLTNTMQEQIQKLEAQRGKLALDRKNQNKYFYYKGEYHKINDTGQTLVVRVKDEEGNWTMRSVARIIMEEYLKQPQPTPKHRIGFKDFDYRNITPINMIWETPKEKAERFHKMFPFKKKSNNHEHQNIDLTHNPGELHDEIVRLLAAGNNYRQAANKLGISYYRLYRYCKRRGM